MPRLAGLLAGTLLGHTALLAGPLPHLQQNGRATQLIVDGAPYLVLGGELHNSSPSSPAYMAPIWDRLARNNVRTVIGAASWELVEPQEGRFDFTAVDDQIRQARAKGIRLVLIWFGAYKNAQSTYAPSWVRRDEARFPRVAFDPAAKPRGIGAYLGHNPTLSVFSEALVQADARAFAALMDHIRQVDRNQTVIMMQVENEVGLIGDSRDRSAPAAAAWGQPVPSALIAYLRGHRATLRPAVEQAWGRNGYRDSGTWAEVFGTDNIANEIFMAWGFGTYVDRVTKAGAAKHALPMFTNAWLGPQPGSPEPGDYPSGGPVARMMDVWKAAAPSLALLAPDIYINDFAGTLAEFKRPDNPIFIPEAKPDTGNLFVALGSYDAIAFSPFGIEDVPEGGDLYRAYGLLNEMTGTIASAQAEGRIGGFKIAGGKQQQIQLGGYDINLTGPMSTLGAFGAGTGTEEKGKTEGYGLVINSAPDQFLIVGRGISATFAAPGVKVEVDSAQEGLFRKDQWVPGRTMNGDERFFLFPKDDLRIIRLTLLKR
ncbi:DUF5597 domain-containing protein [Sphingobium sufflavum]|uniref:GH35 family beta-galactosidase n=1 Tax=Sphingobium sufflavum TaxID=1129547 RepID=UPI001F299BE6|nr:DUF5597 domain-containing protein [Sphingobium sufflavum]MCE7797076.1 DUF5597 domain-containing protein [Sphingobium sufflavum]